jgi:high affinity Mn2+ porin
MFFGKYRTKHGPSVYSNSARFALAAALLAAPYIGCAQATDSSQSTAGSRFNLHFQTTYIYQYKPEFAAAYSGPNSLSRLEERDNSLTATLYVGAKLWRGGELYINPEIAGGSGLSGAFGMGASSNGETFRVGDPAPTLYLGRGYLRQTFKLGAATTSVDDQANQLTNTEPTNYLRFIVGKFSLGDIFDNNLYANSPRTQFLNWCLMNNGAYDYAANVRGYTLGFATILHKDKMTYRAALASLPVSANGADLNTNPGQAFSLNAEVDRAFRIKSKTGNIRLIGYYNNGHMGRYRQALQHPDSAGLPDIISTRAYGRSKSGLSLNADLQLTKTTGIFMRAGWNDGATETWAFTEVDRSLSAGIYVSGARWNRKEDGISLAVVTNGLSADHKDYLAAGGLGFQLGDGRLTYANETGVELYYSLKPTAQPVWLSADYQFLLNPGYNSDRGPVHVCSIRVHVEL